MQFIICRGIEMGDDFVLRSGVSIEEGSFCYRVFLSRVFCQDFDVA